MNDFDKIFKVLGLYKFSEERAYNVPLKSDDGCALLAFNQINVSVKICQVELVLFIHSKISWEGDLTLDDLNFTSNLSTLLL